MTGVTTPLLIRTQTLANRVVVPPMCTWMADKGTGMANDQHLVHYGSLAESGVGLIIVEATAVASNGYISAGDLGLWKDEQIEPLKRIVDYVHKNTQTKIGIQLGHCGRKGAFVDAMVPNPVHLGPEDEFGFECWAPSAIKQAEGLRTPKEMTLDDIEQVKADFVSAARRALEAGFDAIEVHCAHGYLLHSFYSPVSNKRTDRYGGSFENRVRLPLEIAEEIRSVLPESTVLIYRISCTDWVDEGWTLDDSVQLCTQLKSKGVDVIDCSSGGVSHKQDIQAGFLYQVPFADEIKAKAPVLTMAVGGIRDYEDAETILGENRADLIGIGRAFLKDVYWLRNQLPQTEKPWYPPRQMFGYWPSKRKQTATKIAEIKV